MPWPPRRRGPGPGPARPAMPAGPALPAGAPSRERERFLVSERDRLCRRRSLSSEPLMGSGAGAGGAAEAPLPQDPGAADAPGADRCAESPFPLVKGVQGLLSLTLRPSPVTVPPCSSNPRASSRTPRLAKETSARTLMQHGAKVIVKWEHREPASTFTHMGWEGGVCDSSPLDIAAHHKLRRVKMSPPPGTSTTRGPVGFLRLHCRVLAACWDQGVILWVGFDEVCNCLGDGGSQQQGGPKAPPLSPQ